MAALAAAGDFKPFAQVLDQTLVEVLAQQKLQATPEQRGEVMAKLKELTPRPDAAECVDILRAAGIAPFALTNGSVDVASAMLANANLKLATIVSVEDVGMGKPHRRVYEHGAKAIGAQPGELALIAAHGWDINGAKAAGLVTGYLAAKPFPLTMRQPDYEAQRLSDLARLLAGP
jgi:2-haloacid dehalogenase